MICCRCSRRALTMSRRKDIEHNESFEFFLRCICGEALGNNIELMGGVDSLVNDDHQSLDAVDNSERAGARQLPLYDKPKASHQSLSLARLSSHSPIQLS